MKRVMLACSIVAFALVFIAGAYVPMEKTTHTGDSKAPTKTEECRFGGAGTRRGGIMLTTKDGREIVRLTPTKKGLVPKINDDLLMELYKSPVGPRRYKTGADFKNALLAKLKARSGKGEDNGPPDLRWPITCDFYCPIHKNCESYKWQGF